MSLDLDPVLGNLTQRRRSRSHMKVATMTVVAFFDDSAVGDWTRDRIHALASKHPSRVILLDGSKPGEADLGTECPDHEDCVRTRGDWIEIGAQGVAPELLHSAVSTLSLPEAPVVLIWVATGVDGDPRFAALSQSARTIVFNTSVLTFDAAALAELVGFSQACTGKTLTDLAYLRLYPWQEAVAQFFDVAHCAMEIDDLRRVAIVCGSDAEAYYLLGWLASRLEWTPLSASSFRSRLGTQIDFTIERKGLPRRILRVELASSATTFVAEIDDERAEAIVLSVRGAKTHPGRARPINNIDIAALVERAILTGHSDRVFQESLRAAGRIIERRKA